jgi:hypothetical protein
MNTGGKACKYMYSIMHGCPGLAFVMAFSELNGEFQLETRQGS